MNKKSFLKKEYNLLEKFTDNILSKTILSLVILSPFILSGGLFGSISICFLLFQLLLVCNWIERGIKSFSIIGPFTFSFFLNTFIGSGLGLTLYYWGLTGDLGRSINSINVYQMQIYSLLGCPFLIFGYWLVFRKLNFRKIDFQSKISLLNKKQLTDIALYLLIFIFLEAAITFLTGGWDRSNLDLTTESTATNSATGIFIAFTNFKYLGYLMVPFLISQSKFSTKQILLFAILSFLILASATGTRSFIIYCFIYSGLGFFIFKTIPINKIKKILSLFLILTIIIIPTFQLARGSVSFYGTKSTDFVSRWSSLLETSTNLTKIEPKKMATLTGAAMYGKINDAYIYKNVPKNIQYDGFNNFESLLYIFIPKTIYPNKPNAYDGDEIARRYAPRIIGGLASISFNADLYRRFGVYGIMLGNFLFGLLLGLIVKKFFLNFYLKPDNFNFSCILLLYVFNNFSNTVLTNFWFLSYNIPKYLLFLYLLFLLTKQRKFKFN